MTLPDKAIATVHRSDGSGTNFIFTHYLSSVDPEFKEKIGENTSVEFPGGLGGKGNEGVAALAGRTDGAIGYVEYAYALQNKMTYTQLKNHDGAFVSPDSKTFQAAAAQCRLVEGARLLPAADRPAGQGQLADHRRDLHPDAQAAGQAGQGARRCSSFFDWAYHNGGQMAEQLDYVPMPASCGHGGRGRAGSTIVGPDGKPVWTGQAS